MIVKWNSSHLYLHHEFWDSNYTYATSEKSTCSIKTEYRMIRAITSIATMDTHDQAVTC